MIDLSQNLFLSDYDGKRVSFSSLTDEEHFKMILRSELVVFRQIALKDRIKFVETMERFGYLTPHDDQGMTWIDSQGQTRNKYKFQSVAVPIMRVRRPFGVILRHSNRRPYVSFWTGGSLFLVSDKEQFYTCDIDQGRP